MNPEAEAHLQRIRSGTDPNLAVSTIADYLTTHTVIKGKPFSFVDHEYQKTLSEDPAPVKYCLKCSQIGITEYSLRRAIAALQLYAEINLAYILPSATLAAKISATRFATALQSCKPAREAIYKTDSVSVKRWVNESFAYFMGASRAGQAISVPVTRLVVDEVDYAEDQDVLTSFTSRMTHADPRYYDEFWFSTPTVGGYGISHLFDNSQQYAELQRCCHCNHEFIPDYYSDVKLPGFNATAANGMPVLGSERTLKEINFLSKEILTQYTVAAAYLECPKCRRPVDQDIKYRRFVCVNPDSNFEPHGYKVTAFSAPKYMPPSKMIKTSTSYKAVKDFVNNCLGLPHDDESTGLSERELSELFCSDIRYPDNPSYQIAGTDLGGTCAHLTAYAAPDGHIRIMSAQQIPLHRFQDAYRKSTAENRVISAVIDSLPYTDTVAALQATHPSLWACLFSSTKGVELYSLRDVEADENTASYGIRQITAKKHALLDFVVSMIRAGRISFAPSTFHERDNIIAHLRDSKRIQITNKDGEVEFVWRKSATGVDHYFYALAYLVLANFLKGLGGGLAPLPFLAGKFKVKNENI